VKFEAVHLLPGLVQQAADLVAEIARDPVAHEAVGDLDPRDAAGQARELQGLDPGHVVVLAHRLEEFIPHAPPSIVRHSYVPVRSTLLRGIRCHEVSDSTRHGTAAPEDAESPR